MAATNLQALKPVELMRMINTTKFGEVLSEPRLRRHRNRAGYTIGDDRTINLIAYTGWLVWQRFYGEKKQPVDYEEKKRRMAERSADLVRAAQDIGELPEVVDPQRKAKGMASFQTFCESYFPDAFYLPWSPDHLKAMAKIERAVRNGGLFALAMSRGSGKTLMCQTAVVWAALTGATPFVCLIASSADRARDLLENIKIWLETNDRLYEDFPEVCFPIRALERIVHRQKGQKYQGIPTRIEWAADRIILPTIEDSLASGVVISCSGLKGSDIRGQNFARADGKVLRPSLIMVDDPQTTESAWSESQSQRREAILAGDVLGMAGPGQKIAGLMACTIIRPGDMADSILNRDKHPEWQGEKTKMVYSFPSNERLWAQYAELRADSLRNDGDGSIATEFYREHKDAMDEGAKVSWEDRYNSDELSAIQHAMNLRLRDEAAFFAEYQNEPLVLEEGEEMLSAEEIAEKTNGYEQHTVPLDCQYLTAFIDVHEKVLYYLLAAWESGFSGYVIDYGTYPDQQRQYFTLREAQRTLSQSSPGSGLEGVLYTGLDSLCNDLFSRVIYREDGMRVHIDRCLIDANWGQSTDVVYQFCRQSKHSNLLLPSHGKYVGASSQPFAEYRKVRGDRIGAHWRIPNILGKRQVKHAVIDTNYWKSFVHARLAVTMGDPGCLSLFGHDSKRHQLLSE
ncbi:MAG: phage terminase large subunit family protein, partial [Planctomycetia bacterium]|nr:phage terminase large subunit family protein [Planctomycetia bacterium]